MARKPEDGGVMETATTLGLLQRRFWELVVAPSGVARAMPELAARDPGVAPLLRWIDADNEETATRRLDVYANMYFFRLLDLLREDYPKLARLVGAASFHNLVTDYLLAHPSRSPSVRNVGRELPGFVKTHALIERWPFLADLAALERTRVEVFDAAEAEAIGRAALAEITPERWGGLRFVMAPALRLVETAYPVERAWSALSREVAPDAPLEVEPIEAAPSACVVYRRGFDVHHRAAGALEVEALGALITGVPFGATCARLAQHLDEERAAAALVELLLGWIDDGFLIGLASD